MTTSTRFLGSCQVCEGDQKLHNGRLVHHGYRRPGHGSIVGDCPGVGEVPYEVSCELVKAYRSNVGTQLTHLEKRLAVVKGGEVVHLTETKRRGAWAAPELVQYAVGVTELYRWERAVEHATWEIESSIRQCKSEIERCTRRIAAWKLKPIRTVEEEQAKARADKDARKAEREVARAAKAAKEAATRAKQDALAAKRRAIREDFESKFRELAASSEALDARQFAARELLHELDKSKYRSWLSRYDLECEEAFVSLGLATQDGLNGRGRPYLRWG